MQLAEANNEMSFEMIQKELQLEPDQVEAFIIDGKNDRFLVTIVLTYPLCLLLPYTPLNQVS